MKGENVQALPDTALNLGLNIRIPNDYITEENHRLRIYKRIAAVEDETRLSDLRGRAARPLWRASAGRGEPAAIRTAAHDLPAAGCCRPLSVSATR